MFKQFGTQQVVKTALLLDTGDGLFDLIHNQLSNLGVRTEHVSQMEGLVSKMTDMDPDIILVDDSFTEFLVENDVLLEPLKDERFNARTLIRISDKDNLEARLESARWGFKGFLTKPVNREDLIGSVNHLMNEPSTSPIKVLLIDDDSITLKFLSSIFQAVGMETVAEADPNAVLDRLAEFTPDVILMDVNMPGCSGFDLASAIRQNSRHIYTPIIFLTAESSLTRRNQVIMSGGDDMLNKSIDKDVLISTIRTRAMRYREIKKVLDQLNESESRFHSFSHTAQDAIIYLDEYGLIQLWNRAASDMFGIEGRSILGKNVYRLIHSSYYGAFNKQLKLAEEADNELHNAPVLEMEIQKNNGDTTPVEVVISSWQSNGKVYYSAIFRDISERKKSEDELLQHRDSLQKMISEATSELEVQSLELQAALKTEKDVNQQQRQFVSIASHEFRTPLAIIDSAAQRIIRSKKMPADQLLGRAAKIRKAVVRMTDLIDSMLTTAAVEEGKQRLEFDACDINALISEVCDHQQEISKNHSITLSLKDLPKIIEADAKALQLIFSNLLANATKYSPDNPEIEVSGYKEGDQICISVRDRGVGIPEKDQPKLFERFYRASTSVGIPGTGLGLYLVKQLVEMHAGSISIESAEGQGTTLSIWLPINVAEKKTKTRQPVARPITRSGWPVDNDEIRNEEMSESGFV